MNDDVTIITATLSATAAIAMRMINDEKDLDLLKAILRTIKSSVFKSEAGCRFKYRHYAFDHSSDVLSTLVRQHQPVALIYLLNRTGIIYKDGTGSPFLVAGVNLGSD